MKPLLLVGEAFGENEVKTKTPFVGASGIELLRMLGEAGVIETTREDADLINKFYREANPQFIDLAWNLHPEVRRTNVFQRHPPGNRIESFCGPRAEGIRDYPALVKGKYVRREFIPELERLGDEVNEIDPNLIVCLGNTPLWAFAGQTGISKLRGTTRLSSHTATGYKLLPTYHPAAVLRQWELRPITVIDLTKAAREAAFPEIRRPQREIWIEPTLEDIREFIDRRINGATLVAIDIETSGNQVTCIGLAPSPECSLVVPFYDSRRKGRSYWPDKASEVTAWKLLRDVLQDVSVRKVFQNGLYDIAFLYRSMGIRVFGAEHDTMLCHHALQPESLKSLGFLGSIYSDEGPWKTERKGTETIKRDE